jgi:hypothetical protein
METKIAELTDFCLLVVPTGSAARQASETVRDRFTFLPDGIRGDLAAAVAERVQNLSDHPLHHFIAVTIAVEPDAIHGSVTQRDEPGEGSDESRFVIPLATPA